MGDFGGRGGPPGGGRAGFGGGARPALPGGTAPGGTAQSGPGGFAPGGGTGGGGFAGPGGGGNMFGGNTQSITQALAYAKAHGGGTIAVSSQSSAAVSIIQSGANVVGIGGFSGRETSVTTSWLAQEITAGHIRYVLTDGEGGGFGGGGMRDSRTGATAVLSKVQSTCKATSVTGLYDCSASAAALAAS
jgi:hypothetical protein